jgi:hypothetical protein
MAKKTSKEPEKVVRRPGESIPDWHRRIFRSAGFKDVTSREAGTGCAFICGVRPPPASPPPRRGKNKGGTA